MRKLTLFLFSVLTWNSFSQTSGTVPNFINYQAILRDASGNELPSGNNVQVNFKIYNTGNIGTVAYEENHSVTIPVTKVVNLKIGKGTVAAGTFSAITWESGDVHYLVSIDGVQIGVKMPFATVPYSFFSGKTAASGLPPGNRHAQTIYFDSLQSKWIPTLNLNNNGDRVSVGGYSNRNKFSVFSNNTLDSSAVFAWKFSANGRDAAFRGFASGTTTNFTANPSQSIIYGSEFYGVNGGTGYGVGVSGVGISDNGNGYGLAGVGSTNSSTATAIGIYASTTASNTNSRYAGYFDNGMVYIKDSLFLGFANNPGTPNDVLSMSSTGKLRWRTLASSSPISLMALGTVTVSPLTPSTSFTITSSPPQFVNQGIGNIIPGPYPSYTLNIPPPTFSSTGIGSITGVYPNYFLNVPPPNFTGTGLANVNGIYPNYTVAVPTPTPGYNNATGTYSFNQGAYSNTINLSPNLSLSGTTLSVAGNTVNLPGLDLWTSPQPTAVVLTNGLGSVGIATTSPTHRFHVVGNTLLNGVTEIGGTAALAAQFKVINSFGHNLSLLVNGSAQSGQLTVGNNGNVTIGNTTTAFSKLFIQHNDANTTGASGTYVNLQNIANAIGTTAGLRFRVGGGGAQQGDFNYKGGIYFVHNGGTTGQGDLIFSNNGQGDNTNATLTHSVMTITSAGNVGIGTSSPAKLFEVAYASPDYVRFTGTTASGIEIRKTGGSDWRIESNASGYLEFSRSTDDFTSTISMFESGTNFLRPSTDNLLTLGGSANRWTTVYASNGVINTSDIRDKENINPLGYGLKEVMKLKPVTFYWKNDKFSTKKIGLIAQEIKTVMPELVNDFEIITDEKTGEQTKIEAKKLGVYYSDMIPVLIKAIQEQQAEIILLKEELNKLKK